jgi:hypothetical protein
MLTEILSTDGNKTKALFKQALAADHPRELKERVPVARLAVRSMVRKPAISLPTHATTSAISAGADTMIAIQVAIFTRSGAMSVVRIPQAVTMIAGTAQA